MRGEMIVNVRTSKILCEERGAIKVSVLGGQRCSSFKFFWMLYMQPGGKKIKSFVMSLEQNQNEGHKIISFIIRNLFCILSGEVSQDFVFKANTLVVS